MTLNEEARKFFKATGSKGGYVTSSRMSKEWYRENQRKSVESRRRNNKKGKELSTENLTDSSN